MQKLVPTVLWLFGAISMSAGAQSLAPVIDTAHAGATVVTGKASPGSAPITIYDMSYPALTPLGRGTAMDNAGNFAVSVDPVLKLGNRLMAVDAQGRRGATVTVIAPSGPAVTR